MTKREEIMDFIARTGNLFGLKEQGKELLKMAARTTSCRYASLLFLDAGGKGFSTLCYFPKSKSNPFSHLWLSQQDLIVKQLKQEKKLLDAGTLTELRSSKKIRRQSNETGRDKIRLLIPLISRKRLIGALVLGDKDSGKYLAEDHSLLENAAFSVALSMEKEYLREQLSQQKEELSRLYTEAEERSRIDGMTGLFNGRALDEALTSEINRNSRYGGIFSLIIFDIDGALRIANNRHGHLAGDELVKKIGVIIKKQIRSSDQAFRIYGGDEFAILLPSTPRDSAGRVAERVRKQLPLELKVDSDPVTASFGVASWPDNGKDATTIYAAADAALYQAKQAGGNQCRYATGT